LVGHGCRPEEAGQLACGGDDGDVAGLAASAEALVESVEAVLGAPGELEDVVGLAGLAVVERDADPRLAQVVPGGLDEDAAGEAGAGLGDRAARLALPGLVERGDETEPGRELARALEAAEVADLEMEDKRGESVSIPRKQRSLATVGQCSGSVASSESRSSSAARRASRPSIAASASR
jgi:hypothetical protein